MDYRNACRNYPDGELFFAYLLVAIMLQVKRVACRRSFNGLLLQHPAFCLLRIITVRKNNIKGHSMISCCYGLILSIHPP